MKSILDYLCLRDVGVLELVFALTPMLSGFGLGGLPLSLLMWGVLLFIVALQGRLNRAKVFKPLLYFVLYWFIHTVVIMVVDDVNFNGIIAQIIYFMSVFVLYPNLDIQKMRGSFNWVAIIAIVGLLYQWADLVRGGYVHPLSIPGLTMSEGRLLSESIRPSSFFMEPAAYVEFMILPLFWSLLDKKRIWTFLIILSIFLTTSTTGILLSFIMLGMSMFGQRAKIQSIFVVLLIGVTAFYSLTHFSAFSAGIEKIQNTDTETNVRLTQGIKVVRTMDSADFLFGVLYDNAFNYCKSRQVSDIEYYGKNVFMPTFWEVILLYGFVGLILYLRIYVKIFKMNKELFPFLICVFATWFSGGYGIQNSFAFSTIFLLVTAEMFKKENKL